MSELPEHEQETCDLNDDIVLTKQNLKGDWLNFFLLLLLFIMVGLPVGLSTALQIILQSRKNTTYNDQALFSFIHWPFSFKLLFAPLVDTIYVQKLGRRKSWLIPVQYILGATLVYTATNIDELLPETGKANIIVLTFVFFVVNLLAAIQGVIVDGWALTMMKKNNVGHASFCNSVGHTLGMLISHVVSILFTSKDFCNKYFRNTPGTAGILTMNWILYSMGILFILVSTLITILKKEKDFRLEDNHVKLNIVQNYMLIWNILKLPSVQLLAPALLTFKIGFATTDVSILKLIDAGVSKDTITVLKIVITVGNIIITLITAKYTTGQKSIFIMLKCYPLRLIFNISFGLLVFYTPQWIESNGTENNSIYYYATFILLSLMQNVLSYTIYVSVMAFFTQKSDPRFGSTYMTLLKTFFNLGRTLAETFALSMIDFLTFKRSSFDPENKLPTLNCEKENKGDCIVDGYYVVAVFCSIIGIVWYIIFKNNLKELQLRGISHWMVKVNRNPTTEKAYSLRQM
ncbi:Major facilitator superfamily domain,Acetyl-coenzyme A transporter 1 [Cinara cedri]|uniref:Major facilitator superfamily domain,Acetyl-coenzyme A transporter 1 n=1 Tax=Cinara cedri TaxID=506608 RepID=A0A5E4N1E7_9HEMI|nr:Major facilitator superfamily domain,Acetyl-coenzyme A transporter 1 [Cinara cedri]